jgi:pimeloyl-ACP methyl ester carboxylesterase
VFLGLQKTRLLDPTLSQFGTNDHPGDYRASGCSGCHVLYANDRFLAIFPVDASRASWRQYGETLRLTTPIAMHRSARSLLAMAAEPGLIESFARMPCGPHYLVSEEGGDDGGITVRLAMQGVPVFRIPACGHGMMADNPHGFAQAVARCLDRPESTPDATP